MQKGITTKILIFIVLGVMAGCGQKKEIKGSEYIPRDALVKVITEIHLMDGATNDVKFYRKYNPADSVDLYGSIFEKYGVTRTMYEATIDEYSKNPKILNQVYDEVLMNLNVMLDKLKVEGESEYEDKQTRATLDFEEGDVY